MPIWILALLLAGQEQAPQTCTLSGSVVNLVTGAPLGKVELLAERTDKETPPASTFSDAKGNFEMVNLPAGHYHLKGHRNGYLDTYYGARRSGSGGTVLVLEAGQEMKDLQVKLAPFGVISGTVRDTDGEPMSGAEVVLYRQSFTDTGHREIRPDAEIVTDDQGQYRSSDLEPGKYYIRAAARSRNDYGFQTPVDHSRKPAETPPVLLPTLYPGVVDPSAARTVEVGVGARLSGIDITLVRGRVFRVSGTAGTPIEYAALFNAPRTWRFGLQLQSQLKSRNGEFEFDGVPAGAFTLEAQSRSDGKRARLPLMVGGSIDGLRVAVAAPAEVTGHITVEGSEQVDLSGIRIVFDGGGDENSSDAVIGEGQSFAGVIFAAHYQVYLDTRNLKLILKSIRSEGADIYQKGLTVADGSKTALEIVLAPEGGQVEGVVLDKDDKPAAGATVLLVAGERSRTDSFHAETTDQYGRYHFENIRPGEYKLFGFDDVERYAWFDPEFLKDVESRGETIALEARGHSATQLHILR